MLITTFIILLTCALLELLQFALGNTFFGNKCTPKEKNGKLFFTPK